MNQEIVNAIAAYLDKSTVLSDDFRKVRFEKKLGARTGKDEFCQEIAKEISAKIDPLLPKAVGWEDAPPWAKWRAIDENENIAYSLDFPSANTKMEVPKGFTSTVKVERRPNDQTPSLIR